MDGRMDGWMNLKKRKVDKGMACKIQAYKAQLRNRGVGAYFSNSF